MSQTVFEPSPWIRGGHAQTLYAFFFPGPQFPYAAVPHRIGLGDGDTLVVHDDTPEGWQPGDRVAILSHGLAGCHQSPYVNRVAGKLVADGVRTFRMDLRGCGAGAGLAKRPYHAGRSGDLRDVVLHVADLCGDSPISLVGFSLSGNIVLKYLGEEPDKVHEAVTSAMAICPAADLPESQIQLRKRLPYLYDRYFTSLLVKQYAQFEAHLPESLHITKGRRPRTLREFDEAVTAPLWGYEDAGEYYERVSARQWLDRIEVNTLVVAAKDDPVIPACTFEDVTTSDRVRILLAESGGHLGFVGRRNNGDADNRWMDWRIVDWLRDSRTTTPEPRRDSPEEHDQRPDATPASNSERIGATA